MTTNENIEKRVVSILNMEQKFINQQNIQDRMVNLLAKSEVAKDLYNIYKSAGGTLTYKSWLGCRSDRFIQTNALALGYQGELLYSDEYLRTY